MINKVFTGVVINPEGSIGHEASINTFLHKESAVKWLYEQYKDLYATIDKDEFDEGFKKPVSKEEFVKDITTGDVFWVQLYNYHVQFELFETPLIHRIVVKDIFWDTDGEKVELPQMVVIKSKKLIKDIKDVNGNINAIADYLSKKYDFCVYNFTFYFE